MVMPKSVGTHKIGVDMHSNDRESGLEFSQGNLANPSVEIDTPCGRTPGRSGMRVAFSAFEGGTTYANTVM